MRGTIDVYHLAKQLSTYPIFFENPIHILAIVISFDIRFVLEFTLIFLKIWK